MALSYRALFIDVGNRTWRVREFRVPDDVLGPVDLGIKLHLEQYESWKHDVFHPSNAVVMGGGIFMGARMFGVHRLATVYRSPESKVLHVSTMGGAAYKFCRCGAHAVIIEGRASRPTIVLVRGSEKGVESVEFHEVYDEQLWDIYTYYDGYRGAYALIKWVADKFRSFVESANPRIIAVGPAALRTVYGALVSVDIDPKTGEFIEGSEDFAARGSPGSVLARAHNVVAIAAGGSWSPSPPEKLRDVKTLDEVARKVLGKGFLEAVTGAGKKYRYDPGIGAGGTFGVNYPHYRELLPMFNFNSMYLDREVRKKIVEYVLERYWKPFKVEVFDKARNWKTCGEPCPFACKKVWRGKKVDYEPFQGFGPLIGIVDLEYGAELVDIVDQLGFDAIGTSHVVAWLLEAVYRGLLAPEEVGIATRPNLDPVAGTPEQWSVNYLLARQILEGLVQHRTEVLKIVAEKGIRAAAKELDERFAERVKRLGLRFEDLVVYLPFGSDGYMTPNLYWAPGFLSPIAVSGKYWTYYAASFAEPEEFAKTVAHRALMEYLDDNAGLCRFHRGWFEKLVAELLKLAGIEIDPVEHAKRMYAKIVEYEIKAGYRPRLPESAKAKDVFLTIAREMGATEWVQRFTSSKDEALREWWSRFAKTFAEVIGLPSDYAEIQ